MSEKVVKGKPTMEVSKSKIKEKAKEKEKNVLTVEWDSNSSASNCVLCNTPFGRITNRRHHCRNCGRLVCEPCSSRKFQLTDGNTEPQRVCDVCYHILDHKREMKIQVVQLKDKNLELMLATSMISDSLINLFYLDGSTKTIGIDETTTISELATLACSFMSIALFEVVQNIQSASQYKMLLPEQNVVALIDQWETMGQPYIKIVMPINNPNYVNFGAHNSDDAFGSRESFTTNNTSNTRESVMHTSRSSVLHTSPMALPPSSINYSSPTPSKSIYKIKASTAVTSPIYLASSADLMSTSLESRRSSPPTSPRSPARKNTTNTNNNSTATTNLTSSSLVDSGSRNSSFSDAPSGTDTHKSNSTSQIMNMRDPAAVLVASQVQVHTLQVIILFCLFSVPFTSTHPHTFCTCKIALLVV